MLHAVHQTCYLAALIRNWTRCVCKLYSVTEAYISCNTCKQFKHVYLFIRCTPGNKLERVVYLTKKFKCNTDMV